MTRKKMHVVESNEEYTIEEQIEHENFTEQDTESSDLQAISRNAEEGFTDSDDHNNEQAETGGTKRRQKRKLKDIWNLPKGKRIVVQCNDLDQPVGEEAKHLGNFLGTVARNGSLCSLSYKDWRSLKGERDKKTNEKINEKAILEQVKMRFLYPARMEAYILRTVGERWRQHKSDLKSLYFDVNQSIEANYNNAPKGVSKDQWRALVNNWISQKAKDISEQNRRNCAKKKSTHTAGTKSFARNREEMREKDPEKKYPHRAVLYIHTHQPKSDKNMNGHVEKLKDILKNQPELADTSQGKTAWKGDALNSILGVDKPGHIHGLGLVPNPNKVFDASTSRRFQNTHLTSLEDTPNEAILSVRLEMEKLGQHIKNQDAEILELKEKTRKMERQSNQESSVLIPTLGDAPSVDGQNSKRKRVYGSSPSQELSMVLQPNNLMIKQCGSNDPDLQPSNKHSIADKNKEALVQNDSARQGEKIATEHINKEPDTPLNERQRISVVSTTHKHDVQNKKVSKGANAAMLANKQQCGSLSWLGASSLAVGTKVFLKSITNQNKDVALATIVSCDPKYKLDGAEISSEFWAVHVNSAFVKTEELVRKRKNCTIIGNAAGTKIAWPSTFIEKING